jgi:hypothetical protein
MIRARAPRLRLRDRSPIESCARERLPPSATWRSSLPGSTTPSVTVGPGSRRNRIAPPPSRVRTAHALSSHQRVVDLVNDTICVVESSGLEQLEQSLSMLGADHH